MATQPAMRRKETLFHSWSSPLSEGQDKSFNHTVHQLETAYAMWSVNLDEALGFRRMGRSTQASNLLGISPSLCERLSLPLLGSLRAMLSHSKHFGTTPVLAPLAAHNFQLARSQRLARFNALFSKLLLTSKAQFQYKISILVELVLDLSAAYVQVSGELNDGSSMEEDRDWDSLDATHYDINSCLRETIVLLKCFLLALPDSQLDDFNLALQRKMASVHAPSPALSRHLAHRRMAFIKGQ